MPARSLEQRMRSLKIASHVRMFRAKEKRDLKDRGRFGAEVRIATLLADPPGEMATMKVIDLLLACPRWGEARAARTLTRCQISPAKTVAGMTDRQRHELIRELGA